MYTSFFFIDKVIENIFLIIINEGIKILTTDLVMLKYQLIYSIDYFKHMYNKYTLFAFKLGFLYLYKLGICGYTNLHKPCIKSFSNKVTLKIIHYFLRRKFSNGYRY